jgi:hypothetical protein
MQQLYLMELNHLHKHTCSQTGWAEDCKIKTYRSLSNWNIPPIGCFQYSHEENTHAHAMMDDVPAETKQARVNELMELQARLHIYGKKTTKPQRKMGHLRKIGQLLLGYLC